MQNQRLGRIQRHTWTDNRAKNAFFYLIFILKQLSKTNKTQFVSDMKKKLEMQNNARDTHNYQRPL